MTDRDPLSPARGVILGVVLGVALWALGVFAAYLFISSCAEVGPDCPGMDPQWLGKCEEPE